MRMGGPLTRILVKSLEEFFVPCAIASNVVWRYALDLLHLHDGCRAHVSPFFLFTLF